MSPCPGKCLALAATPVDCSPAIQAALCCGHPLRVRAEAADPDHRVVRVGVDVDGGREVHVAPDPAQLPADLARPAYRVMSRSSIRPSTALPGYGDPARAKSRVTSPPSSSIAISGAGVRGVDGVGQGAQLGQRRRCWRRTGTRHRARPAADPPAMAGSVVPVKPGSTWSGPPMRGITCSLAQPPVGDRPAAAADEAVHRPARRSGVSVGSESGSTCPRRWKTKNSTSSSPGCRWTGTSSSAAGRRPGWSPAAARTAWGRAASCGSGTARRVVREVGGEERRRRGERLVHARRGQRAGSSGCGWTAPTPVAPSGCSSARLNCSRPSQ